MKKPFKRKKGPVQSKKVTYDGINFASGLERYMYMALRKAKIKSKYEGETFVLLNGFHFDNEDRKNTRLNSSHRCNSYAVFFLKKKIIYTR